VPVTIALYTFLENNNDQSIALANREKDLEIARNQRIQDLQIAADQKRADILAVYESFLVNHLNHYGMTLNESSLARFVARLKTLTSVNQLDSTRKTFLIHALFEAKLIVNDDSSSNPYTSGIISLEGADLSGISFENRALKYVSLPKSNLTRAIFALTDLSCANFYWAVLINSSFYGALIHTIKNQCFPEFAYTIFVKAKMTGTNLCEAEFISIDFSETNLDYANMRHFVCINCLFVGTSMYNADLSFSVMSENSTFVLTNLTETVLPMSKNLT
jgi:uncharacterized protein YjbI with pentapeptide repeats